VEAVLADALTPLAVSVALCTHNGAEFVGEQVDSILNQTTPPRQLVLSDDDSTDDTVALVRESVEVFRRTGGDIELVVLQNHPALGVAQNFAQAIAACTGDLIALSDQDDVWQPRRIEVIARYFLDHPDVTLVHGDARLVDDDGEPLGRTLFESLRVTPRERMQVERGIAIHTLIRRNIVTGATTVFRRSLVDLALPIPSGWIHDEWLAIMAAVFGRVAIVPGLLVDYRQHASNQIGAEELTVRRAVGKLREPRTERNRNLYVRAQSLADRLHEVDDRIDQRYYRIAWAKLEHERFRLALPASRARRILPVFVSQASGNYRRYGMGAQDALRDLVQPT
jgi:glycosyltransferase involved in cell wall biosynthesis